MNIWICRLKEHCFLLNFFFLATALPVRINGKMVFKYVLLIFQIYRICFGNAKVSYFLYILCMDDMMYVKRLKATMLEKKVPDKLKAYNSLAAYPAW